jgi:hypothetical protein
MKSIWSFFRILGNFAPLGGVKSVIIFPAVIGVCCVKFSLNDCEDIDYNIIRMGTPAFEKLQKKLNSSSIEQVLSLKEKLINY